MLTKLLGSVLILSGGGMAWLLRRRERQRQRAVLRDLLTALRRMGEEIRMARTPLPGLLLTVSGDCGGEVSSLFQSASAAASRGCDLTGVWCAGVGDLPLPEHSQALLRDLSLRGDEESICKGLSLVTYGLAEDLEALERRRGEEDKRTAALCLSGAALLVILLI